MTINGNCILFHSDGYGCYGTDFEDVRVMLFEFLFENYDKALVCFEVVKPCQSQGYCFNASWAKPDGEVDWDDDETFYIHRRVHLEDPDEDEGEFDIADIWFLPFEDLELSRETMPNLTKLVDLAKKTGFTDWATDPTGYNSEPGILMKTIREIGDYLEAELEGYDEDLVSETDFEAEEDRLEFLVDIEIDNAEFELPFELPENFYESITTFRKIVRGYLQEPNYKSNDSKEKLDNSTGLTLRLRTKDDLMQLLQAQKSGAWKVAKGKEKQISRVQIFNWDGSMMLAASHDVSNSYRRSEDNRLVVALNEDAKIVKCDPPFQWVGQNPVNYVNDSATAKNNLVEDRSIEQDSESVVNQTDTKEPAFHAPEGFAHLSPQLAELCESVYGEPVRLVHWQMKNENEEQQFNTLFRECRRGWYFQMLLTQNKGKWSSNYRVLPSFLNLLEPDETTWVKLTKSATAEDWYALDEIFLNTLIYPKSKVIFAGSDLVGKEVADEAFKNFGFYVPDEDLLPVLLFEAFSLGVRLISYFRHPDGFAKENMVSDRNTKGCEVYESLTQAQQRLDQKLSYYASES